MEIKSIGKLWVVYVDNKFFIQFTKSISYNEVISRVKFLLKEKKNA